MYHENLNRGYGDGTLKLNNNVTRADHNKECVFFH